MKSVEKYMQGLNKWLEDTADVPLEEMSDFFTKRLDDYEERMSMWKRSYEIFAETLPSDCYNILDLGCGTGLELDKIWIKNPSIKVTGIDMCKSMLDKLQKKYLDKNLTIICQDYFEYDFGHSKWDAVVSFESLHHFLPKKKELLYGKVYDSLRSDGVFIIGDYIACCDEEEELLRNTYLKRREQSAIPSSCFVHFDIPLTLEHETQLLKNAGFTIKRVVDDPDGPTIITAGKGIN